jgi:hypothetical protein
VHGAGVPWDLVEFYSMWPARGKGAALDVT